MYHVSFSRFRTIFIWSRVNLLWFDVTLRKIYSRYDATFDLDFSTSFLILLFSFLVSGNSCAWMKDIHKKGLKTFPGKITKVYWRSFPYVTFLFFFLNTGKTSFTSAAFCVEKNVRLADDNITMNFSVNATTKSIFLSLINPQNIRT